jgi:hypothetical protein
MAQGFRLVGGESHELLLSDVSALLEKGCLCHAGTIALFLDTRSHLLEWERSRTELLSNLVAPLSSCAARRPCLRSR